MQTVANQQQQADSKQLMMARTVMFVCISMLPLTLFAGLVPLQVVNGNKDLESLQGAYVNPHTVKEYAAVFSELIDERVVAEMRQSLFFAVLADESTDVALEKHSQVRAGCTPGVQKARICNVV